MRSPRPFLCCSLNINNNRRSLSNEVLDRVYKTHSPSQNVETSSNHVTVGITEFVGAHPKVRAGVRERNSDFQVNEIDLDGKIVTLTDLNLPTTTPSRNIHGQFFTHCILSKDGMSMHSVAKKIGGKLGIPTHSVAWAGSKDRDARTCQRISICNVDASRLARFSNNARFMRLGNFSYASNPILLGDLQGNLFTILLRDVQLQDSSSSPSGAIEVAAKSWKERGFVNYYGLQRFGDLDAPSFESGRAALQHNWEKFFDLMLRPRPNDKDFMLEAKALWVSTRDPVKIVQSIPDLANHRSEEASLFMGLARSYDGGKGNLADAFLAIPGRYRGLTVFSFQSYIWNHVASFRLKNFGLQPIPGDLVKLKEEGNDNKNEEEDSLVDANDNVEPSVETYASREKLKILTEDDLKDYSIDDVLLPAPGLLIPRYPQPLVQDYYENLLRENGLEADPFSTFPIENEAPEGTVRHLIAKPKNVSCKLIHYDGRDDIDMDTFMFAATADRRNFRRKSSPVAVQNKICAQLRFSLISSSYATMALREMVDFSMDDDTCSGVD